jgi:hypothetical protein
MSKITVFKYIGANVIQLAEVDVNTVNMMCLIKTQTISNPLLINVTGDEE